MEGMAPEDATHGHEKPPEDPVFLHRLIRVSRTGGHISATGREMGGNRVLVKANTLKNNPKQRFTYIRHGLIHDGIHHNGDPVKQ